MAATTLSTGAGVAGAAAGLLVALAGSIGGDRRHHLGQARPTGASLVPDDGEPGHEPLPDGRALLTVAGVTLLLALGGACVVLGG